MTRTLDSLTPLIEAGWNGARILVVGDVMLDKYAYGQVSRISPEAPVPVVRAVRSSEQPGGAANVAMNVATLGGQAILVGFTGADQDRGVLENMLSAAGVQPLLIAVPGIPTTSKLRVLGGQQQIVRLDYESTAPRPALAYDELLRAVGAVLPRVSAVILSDYAKGTLTPEVCKSIIESARSAGIPVLVDPKARDFSQYAGATTICPNLGELAAATGEAASDLERLLDRGQSFIAEHRLEYLTVTMSEKGITVLEKEGRLHAPAVARQVFDVSGAGDTVIATLALCAASNVPVQMAAPLANLAAGIVVAKVGTVPASKDELLAELLASSGEQLHNKILNIPQLQARAAQWRAAGDQVVFTNGCFDLVHVGHVTLLEQCRSFGTRLVIGINSDASVSGLKGPTRPIIGQQERARLLAALSVTDAVVIFDDPTPMSIIRALKPDVLVKGGDYTEATVVGADEVKAWGGSVKLVPLVPGFSTTDIVRRLSSSSPANSSAATAEPKHSV